MRAVPFIKMDGLGNDFVIIDERKKFYNLSLEDITIIADRKTGVGFDQLIILRSPTNSQENTIKILIYNSDGSSAGACGNGTRCVGSLLTEELDIDEINIEAPFGRRLTAGKAENGLIWVNMGKPNIDWQSIPLVKEMDTLIIEEVFPDFYPCTAVNVGNPHAVFFVDNIEDIDLEGRGEKAENHQLFPERANIEFVQVLDRETLRMRVWERGAGVTCACGTGACATLVAAVRRGLAERTAKIIMDGGELIISWDKDSEDILMTGAAHKSFVGTLFLE